MEKIGHVKLINGISFREFENACSAELSKVGVPLSIHDLADATWRDYYESGMSPRAAIECANDDAWDGDLNDILHG
mgnify:FL=1